MNMNKKGLKGGLIILGILLHLYSLGHYQVYFAVFYTILIFFATGYLFWKNRGFHRKLNLKIEKYKEARLYEPPTDLPPMVLAYYLYGLDLVVLSPDGYAKWGISFNSLVQATLLDLLDRGVLQLTEGVKGTALSWVSKDSLEEFEVFFLRMIFGEQK